jgi:hypothetical protein
MSPPDRDVVYAVTVLCALALVGILVSFLVSR